MCYLARADRGDRPALVRLVGAGSDQTWAEFGATDSSGVRREIDLAAAWVAERAGRGDGPRHELELLVVDVEGSACAWVTSPSSDAVVIGAALSGEDGDWSRVTERTESTVQALADPETRGARRGAAVADAAAPVDGARKLAVLMVPDVPARLLTDSLDERGVAIARVASLWQAVAQAWDPAGPGASGEPVRGERVVASSAPVSAVVLIDPAGRIVWSWSREGELMTGGAVRISAERRDETGNGSMGATRVAPIRVGQAEIGRLTTDWLSWSMQLGVAPARILCLGPGSSDDPDTLTPAAIGAALTRAWPGAAVDLVVHEDPIGATLMRLARTDGAAGQPGAPRTTLTGLTLRPGRSHRSLYRWAALAVLAFSAALLGIGWNAWNQWTKEREAADAALTNVRDVVTKAGKPKGDLELAEAQKEPRLYLQKKIDAKRASLNPTSGMTPAKPILPELETLSMVLVSSPGVQLEEIRLQPTNALMYLLIPDTRTFEELKESLRTIRGQHIEWRGQFGTDIAGKKRYSFEGAWIKPAAPGAAPASTGAPGAPKDGKAGGS